MNIFRKEKSPIVNVPKNIMSLVIGRFKENTYIVSNKNECILIDPGNDAKKIIDQILKNNLTPVAILLTHGHFDHIGGVNEILEKWDLTIYGGKNSNAFCNNPQYHYGSPKISINKTIHEQDDNTEIKLINYRIKFMATPGHTMDSCFIIFEDLNCIFTGDTLFYHDIGALRFATNNKEQMRLTLKKIKELRDSYLIFPGHNNFSTIGEEKINNPYLIKDLI
ncbi:MAG: MBL fold metallo-hydrolase [Mycoplasma sp.]